MFISLSSSVIQNWARRWEPLNRTVGCPGHGIRTKWILSSPGHLAPSLAPRGHAYCALGILDPHDDGSALKGFRLGSLRRDDKPARCSRRRSNIGDHWKSFRRIRFLSFKSVVAFAIIVLMLCISQVDFCKALCEKSLSSEFRIMSYELTESHQNHGKEEEKC